MRSGGFVCQPFSVYQTGSRRGTRLRLAAASRMRVSREDTPIVISLVFGLESGGCGAPPGVGGGGVAGGPAVRDLVGVRLGGGRLRAPPRVRVVRVAGGVQTRVVRAALAPALGAAQLAATAVDAEQAAQEGHGLRVLAVDARAAGAA